MSDKFSKEEMDWADSIAAHVDDPNEQQKLREIAQGWIWEKKRAEKKVPFYRDPRNTANQVVIANLNAGQDIYRKLAKDTDNAYIYILELTKGDILEDGVGVYAPRKNQGDRVKVSQTKQDVALRERIKRNTGKAP